MENILIIIEKNLIKEQTLIKIEPYFSRLEHFKTYYKHFDMFQTLVHKNNVAYNEKQTVGHTMLMDNFPLA